MKVKIVLVRGVWTKADADTFITQVNSMGSKIPVVDFDTYVCSKM